MIEIITALLPIAIKLISMAIEKQILDQEQKKAFLDFIQVMATKENMSTKSREQFKKLRDKLNSD